MNSHKKNIVDKNELASYRKAKKRVDRIKSFYGHLFWYVFVNTIIFIAYYIFLQKEYHLGNWLKLNLFTTTFLWGIGIYINWLYAFKPQLFTKFSNHSVFSKRWEERKLEELLEKDEEEKQLYN